MAKINAQRVWYDTILRATVKYCSTCHNIRPVEAFGPHKRRTSKLQSACRTCKREEGKRWSRRPDVKQRKREWALANPGKMQASLKRYQKSERGKLKQKIYRYRREEKLGCSTSAAWTHTFTGKCASMSRALRVTYGISVPLNEVRAHLTDNGRYKRLFRLWVAGGRKYRDVPCFYPWHDNPKGLGDFVLLTRGEVTAYGNRRRKGDIRYPDRRLAYGRLQLSDEVEGGVRGDSRKSTDTQTGIDTNTATRRADNASLYKSSQAAGYAIPSVEELADR